MSNFDPWAGYMQGQQSFGNSLAGIAQLEQHRKDQERANRLSDLQYKIAERSYNQDMDLERKLSEAQPRQIMSIQPTLGDIGGIPGEQYLPRTRISDPPSSGTMGDLMPGSARLSIQEQQPFQMQQRTSPEVQAYHDGRMTSRTEQPDRMQIIADTRMAQGRPEDAFKAISLKDNLAQYEAKVKSGGGSIEEFYKAKQGLDDMTKFAATILPYVKNGTLKGMWPRIVADYPKAASMNPNDFKPSGNGIVYPLTTQDGTPLPGKFYHYDSDGEVKVIDDGTAKDAAMERRMERQISAADARQERGIAAADARAEKKGQTPGKTLPASQLEGIADMKRLKDVMAEAGATVNSKGVSTGPLQGRAQSAGAMVGLASDDFVDVQQKLQTAQNIMLKLRSGAAVTESEYSRFLKEFPTPNDPPEVFKRKMANATNYASTLMDEKMNIYEEGGYRVPRQTTQSGAKPQPSTPSAPKPGQVVKGYRFKGGNPSDKNNWVKQ